MNYLTLLPRLDDWPREKALVLDKIGRRKDAANTLATKCSLNLAENYAQNVFPFENVYNTVFDGLIEKNDEVEALIFLGRNFDRLDLVRAIGLFPDSLSLETCMDSFTMLLSEKNSAHLDHLVIHQLLKRENMNAKVTLLNEKSKYVILDGDRICPVCTKGFKADSAIVVSNSQVTHYACHLPPRAVSQ